MIFYREKIELVARPGAESTFNEGFVERGAGTSGQQLAQNLKDETFVDVVDVRHGISDGQSRVVLCWIQIRFGQ